MDWYIENYWLFLLLLLFPVLVFLIVQFTKWKKNKRLNFAEEKFHQDLFEKKSKFSAVLPVLYLTAVLFLIFSIIDLLKGSEDVKTLQKMNNVIFVLDVSNSMNAEDIQPNRLTEAKNIIIGTMDKMKNDKVGIVVFAGDATSVMPLTTDYSTAETYIGGLETNIMKVQGTDFLKGMQVASEKFKNVAKGSRKIVLVSDGEDNEGNEDAAIKEAKREGMTVITVGIGTDEGAPVPEYAFGQLMGYKTDLNTGETVISKRQTEALRKIASSTEGSYIDGNNLEQASQEIVDALNRKNTSSETLIKSQNAIHYYQYFLAVSLFFFLVIYLFNPKKDLNI
ncbi:vWA domain-containing protein [Chryseobacterium sp.]|uniref:vWA domain-containing protein n=1 Tax=Chryseobacterium sp. TaxID=1871047 RepID=UPI0011CCB504|nr:VWA domain-containing protein [Chryseobacterium sp.]TXF79336.1 VWA domain-containing protein [Chryseobacterium sp.]